MLMFSYGSGLAATLFSLQAHSNHNAAFSLKKLLDVSRGISARLNDRVRVSPHDYSQVHIDVVMYVCMMKLNDDDDDER